MVADAGRALQEQLDAEPAPEDESPSAIWSSVDELLRRTAAGAMDQEAASPMPSQMKAYLCSPVVNRRTHPDPLAVWDTMRVGSEQLYEIAMEYLVLMSTSTASERLFSHAGSVKTTKRNRLSPKHLKELVFLRSVDYEGWFETTPAD